MNLFESIFKAVKKVTDRNVKLVRELFKLRFDKDFKKYNLELKWNEMTNCVKCGKDLNVKKLSTKDYAATYDLIPKVCGDCFTEMNAWGKK